jgi:hypothetical protein
MKTLDLISLHFFQTCNPFKYFSPIIPFCVVINMNFCMFCVLQSEVNPETENQLAGAESQLNEVRVQYTNPDQPAEQVYSDQEEAASGGDCST